jgi:hypothetical protein
MAGFCVSDVEPAGFVTEIPQSLPPVFIGPKRWIDIFKISKFLSNVS